VKWTIAAIGKPKLPFAAAGIQEYLSRLRKSIDVELLAIKPSRAQSESDALLANTTGTYRIILDERGISLTSRELAGRIQQLENASTRTAAVLIGGADGHNAALRNQADLMLSLSRFTIQHELALLLFLEQLYRASSIIQGFPYHRD